MKSFTTEGQLVYVDTSRRYPNGRLAVVLVTKDQKLTRTDEVWSVLSVNIPEVELEEGEFCVKTWSENEVTAHDAKASGVFEDTGKRVLTGHVEAEVWRFKEGA